MESKSILKVQKEKYLNIYIGILTYFGLFLLFFSNVFFIAPEQQYVFLAKSFLDNKLYFTTVPSYLFGWQDTSYFNGFYYWPLGISPALLIIPFLLFGYNFFHQGILSFILILITIVYLYAIFIKIGLSNVKARLLTFSYIFCTAYIGTAIAPMSWYLGHIVASTFLILAIYIVVTGKSPFLSGLFLAISFLSRISIILGILFFIFEYSKEFNLKNIRNREIVKFLIPISIGIGVFFWYNYERFGNIFETGYSMQTLVPQLENSRDLGMWSLKHIPTNLYYMLFKGPDIVFLENTYTLSTIKPDNMGMSIIFTSPVFIYLVFANFKNKLIRSAMIGALPIFIFLMGSFGGGFYQYGYRFALDFQPFLFLILGVIFKERRIGLPIISLLTASYIFNLYLSIYRFL